MGGRGRVVGGGWGSISVKLLLFYVANVIEADPYIVV